MGLLPQLKPHQPRNMMPKTRLLHQQTRFAMKKDGRGPKRGTIWDKNMPLDPKKVIKLREQMPRA